MITITCTYSHLPSYSHRHLFNDRFMDGVKARLPGRLAACLLILDVRTDKVLKVWYENDWDAFSTKVSTIINVFVLFHDDFM